MTGRLADLFQPRAPPVAGLGAATELQPEPEPELEGRQQRGSGLGTGEDADALYITHRLSFTKFQTDDSVDILPRQAKDNNRALKNASDQAPDAFHKHGAAANHGERRSGGGSCAASGAEGRAGTRPRHVRGA
jgi:hypothetical protein